MLDRVGGAGVGTEAEAGVVTAEQRTAEAPGAVYWFSRLDRHRLTDEAAVLIGRAQDPLDPGAGDFQDVATRRTGIGLVEEGGDGFAQAADGVKVGASRTVDQYAEHTASEIDVPLLKPGGRDQGLDQVTYTLCRTHHLLL
jgi:hypothetical protein